MEIDVFDRAYQLKPHDIFSVNLDGFLINAILWSHSFQIMGVSTYRRKHWWQFWKPRKNTFIKIMYLGGIEDE